MRLTRPSLFTGLSVGCDARDLPGEHLNADVRADIAIPQGLPNTGVGHMLLLPQSFGYFVCVWRERERDLYYILFYILFYMVSPLS